MLVMPYICIGSLIERKLYARSLRAYRRQSDRHIRCLKGQKGAVSSADVKPCNLLQVSDMRCKCTPTEYVMEKKQISIYVDAHLQH